ncbi:MAG: pyridoxal-phosphate dependent enzyme [Nanoarchaeota archaeon]
MNQERTRIYESIKSRIGNTPLVQYEGIVPNGNRIFIKRECDNPFGSHYDRVYLALFKNYEEQGLIQPEQKVIETSSGSAGISFAGIGKILGYECYAAMPAGGEKAREEALLKQLPTPGHLILTPAEQYVNGFPRFIKRFLVKNRDYFFLNHSMGKYDPKTKKVLNNEVALKSLEDITSEITRSIDIDVFIPAFGNGTSIVGPVRKLKQINPLSKTIAYESLQSGAGYSRMFPKKYEELFGINPGTLSRHRLPGTSYNGTLTDRMPHLNTAFEENMIDDIMLVSDKKQDDELQRLNGNRNSENLPHWDNFIYQDLGRSSRAGMVVALEIAKSTKNKNIVVVAYDKAERYDSEN